MDEDLINNNFYVTRNACYFDYGAYGICPKSVMQERFRIIEEIEKSPQNAFSITMIPKVEESIEIMRTKFHIPGKNGRSDSNNDHYDVALLENVTTAIMSIMQSIPINEGDELLLHTWTYEGVKTTCNDVFQKRGGKVVTMPTDPDLFLKSEDEIVESYLKFIDTYSSLKYAVIDHIISSIPVVLPVKRLTRELRKRGIIVIIDGAHVAGQIHDFNIQELDPDIYVGNLHKWCFVPRGCAYIIIKKQLCNQGIFIQPPIIDEGYNDDEIHLRFILLGTGDNTAYMCIKVAFEFIDTLGGLKAIHEFNSSLLTRGIEHLEKVWNVTAFKFQAPAPFMKLIPLPDPMQPFISVFENLISEYRYFEYIRDKFGFCAPIFVINKKAYFRICCQVTSTMEDFVKLGKVVLEWMELLQTNHSFHNDNLD